MATDNQNKDTPMGVFLDLKSALLAACALIMFLVGTVFRVWDAASQRGADELSRRLDRMDARDEKFESRLAEMEAGHNGYRFEIEHLKRALERR